MFQHSLMNLGVETSHNITTALIKNKVSAFSDESWGGDRHQPDRNPVHSLFQHSLMNLGVETVSFSYLINRIHKFQHSLMNLGVETTGVEAH